MGSGIYEYYGISCRRRSCAQCTQRAAACGGRLPEGAGRRAPFSCQRALSEGILSGAARVRPAQGRDGDPSCGPTGARRGAARLLRTHARQPRRRQAGSRRCSASGALHPPGGGPRRRTLRPPWRSPLGSQPRLPSGRGPARLVRGTLTTVKRHIGCDALPGRLRTS